MIIQNSHHAGYIGEAEPNDVITLGMVNAPNGSKTVTVAINGIVRTTITEVRQPVEVKFDSIS